MERSVRLSKAGQPIESLEQWRLRAHPKGKDRQWEPGRSACELASAWCEPDKPTPPVEFRAMLRTRPVFASMHLLEGFPEDRVSFDDYPGEPRNADLNLKGQIGAEHVAISVEGKADESFGPTVRGALQAAKKRRSAGKASNAPARIRRLTAALFRKPVVARHDYLDLPYQLLTGTAATLALAKRFDASTALFVVHEFVGGTRRDGRAATSAAKVHRNSSDLNRFVSALAGKSLAIAPGEILGPFRVPGNAHIPANVELFIGKARRDLAG